MFNTKRNGDGDAPEAPDQSQMRRSGQFRMPNLSTWEIWYVTAVGDIKKAVVSGHGMTLGNNGSITIQTFYLDQAFGPTPRPTWGRSSYVSFMDMTPAPVAEDPDQLIQLH